MTCRQCPLFNLKNTALRQFSGIVENQLFKNKIYS